MQTTMTSPTATDSPWLWDGGDYTPTATDLEPLSAIALDLVGDVSGRPVLDLGTGTGNAALEAARRGARTIGVDRARRLMGIAREREEAEGLDVRWVVGDLHDLPFLDASFDAAVSVSAAVLVPGAARTAAEVVRVLKPGGKAVLVGWDGTEGGFMPPALLDVLQDEMGVVVNEDPGWFGEDRIERLLAPLDASVRITRRAFRFGAEPTAEAVVDRMVQRHPTMVAAAHRLAPDVWATAVDAFRAHVQERATTEDGLVALPVDAFLIEIERHAA